MKRKSDYTVESKVVVVRDSTGTRIEKAEGHPIGVGLLSALIQE